MVWKRWRKAPTRKAADQVRCRPTLDSLEDRTLLSITTFYVDDTQSVLTLSGNISGTAIQQQGAGSLVTAYTGDVQADVDLGNGVITFNNNGDGAQAENSGNWAPRSDGSSGSEAANYGGQVNIFGLAQAAVRNLVAGATSDALPLNPLGDGATYQFPNNEHFLINSGAAAYTHPLLGHGTYDLSGQGADNQADSRGNGSYLVDFNGDGSFLGLYVSVDITLTASFSGFNATLNIDGTLVAYGSLGTGPAAHGGHQGSEAALGTSLIAGNHAAGQALLSNPLGNLEHSGSAELRQVNPADASAQNGLLGTSNSEVHHQAAADQLDAAFVEMGPIEHLAI